jgi:hypothetical protein
VSVPTAAAPPAARSVCTVTFSLFSLAVLLGFMLHPPHLNDTCWIISLLSSASSVARGLFDNLLDRGAGLFAGVKNILPVSKDLVLTKIVDALLENRSIPEVEKYLYFDPKLAKKGLSENPCFLSKLTVGVLSSIPPRLTLPTQFVC